MSDRDRILTDIRERAEGRRIFGFTRDWASCEEPKRGKVPANWDYVCVEGDPVWTPLPRDEEIA